MLARSYRLPSTTRLLRPSSLRARNFILKYSPGIVSHARCSIVVSKKVDKRAAKRNSLRRAIIQEVGNHIRLIRNFDILIILQPPSVQIESRQLQEDIRALLTKQPFL